MSRTDSATDANLGESLSWATMTWQDIQAVAMALAERHPEQRLLPMTHADLAGLVCALPGFAGRAEDAPDHLLSAIVGSWIALNEGDEDSSPYEFLA